MGRLIRAGFKRAIRSSGKSGKRGGNCCYCKRGPLLASTDPSGLAFTFDHVNPRARGGGRKVPCCRKCNGLKGALTPSEWFWFIDNHPRYWRAFRTHEEVYQAVAIERRRRAAIQSLAVEMMVEQPLTTGEINDR